MLVGDKVDASTLGKVKLYKSRLNDFYSRPRAKSNRYSRRLLASVTQSIRDGGSYAAY